MSKPSKLYYPRPGAALFRSALVVTPATVVVTEADCLAALVNVVEALDKRDSRKADRHKGSRAAYMRAYRAKQKA